jgi:hypothetical protein
MTYREVIIPENNDFNPKSSLKSIKGEGTVEDKSGKRVNYRYYMITDDKGEIGGSYLGTNQLNTTGPVRLSKEGTLIVLSICKAIGDEKRRGKCIRDLYAQVLVDCLRLDKEFDSEEDCAEHCWYRGGKCYED